MRVLITEDDAAIQMLLARQLSNWGFETLRAGNGQEAIDLAGSATPPDVIVMDWMMPVMSGLEACRVIRELPGARCYIIMLTSKHERADMVAALSAGADDFLSKPVDSVELHSRLKVAERIINYEKQLREYGENMELLAEERARQLVHADRLVTIGTLVSGIIHEINSPLGAVMGSAQVIAEIWKDAAPEFAELLKVQNPPKLAELQKEVPSMLSCLMTSAKRINEIVSTIKRFYKKNEETAKEPCNLNECVENAVKVCWPRLKYKINVRQEFESPAPHTYANRLQLEQVLVNLLMNASEALVGNIGPDFSLHTQEQTELEPEIVLTTKSEKDLVILSVFDNGPAIPEPNLQRIWDSFFTTKAEGTGLGLSICAGIIRDHNGTIEVENVKDGGVCFSIKLPLIS